MIDSIKPKTPKKPRIQKPAPLGPTPEQERDALLVSHTQELKQVAANTTHLNNRLNDLQDSLNLTDTLVKELSIAALGVRRE